MFAGQRAETFYFDLGAVFDTLILRRYLPTLTGPGEDADSVNPFGVNRFRYVEDDLNLLLAQRGFFARMFRSLFNVIDHSWKMYPLGFLFGLGFDTTTEVGLLGISAAKASNGLPIWSILLFPALFAAGMSLVDTTDGVMILGAYGWAYMKPIRKLYYNMAITFVSVVVALVVGGIEALGLIGSSFGLTGRLCRATNPS